MDEVIKKFQKSSYYKFLIDRDDIILIYISGSRITGLEDECSDYDIVILVANGEYDDCSRYVHVRYKNTIGIHWYYHPLDVYFTTKNNTCTAVIQLRNLCDDVILYKNPKYDIIINKLYQYKDKLSNIQIYSFLNKYKNCVNNIITDGFLKEDYYSKYLYHLCLASYYILNDKPDKEFLKNLKHIYYNKISKKYELLTIKRLKLYRDFIEQNPIDVDKELNILRKQILDK